MLPKNLKYQNKVESASARAYTSAIQPQNGTGIYTAGNTITINIPTSPNTVLVPNESVGVERWTLAQSQIPHHIWSQINNKFTPKTIKTIRQHI